MALSVILTAIKADVEGMKSEDVFSGHDNEEYNQVIDDVLAKLK